jgi:Tol biopolymer transport system component
MVSGGEALFFVSNAGGSMDLWRQAFTSGDAPIGEPQQVTTGVGLRSASLSPDGQRVAYSRGRSVSRIWRTPVSSTRPASWQDAEPVLIEDADAEFLDPSPDGTRLAVSSDRRGNKDIYVLALQSGTVQQLTDHPAPDWNPRFSPDGRWVGFYSLRSGNRDLWVMPATGGAARQLTSDEAADWYLTWSPDGERIAIARTRDRGDSIDEGVWVIPSTGGEAPTPR